MKNQTIYNILLLLIVVIFSCQNKQQEVDKLATISLPANTLNYIGTPTDPKDRTSLAFSDQGAWFAYGLPSDPTQHTGFSGPFLMTQENGIWASEALSQLDLINVGGRSC